eukprot:15447239-Alexandrium_andersonii.AAC.1
MVYRAVIFGAVDFGSMIIDRAAAVVEKSKAASDVLSRGAALKRNFDDLLPRLQEIVAAAEGG